MRIQLDVSSHVYIFLGAKHLRYYQNHTLRPYPIKAVLLFGDPRQVAVDVSPRFGVMTLRSD